MTRVFPEVRLPVCRWGSGGVWLAPPLPGAPALPQRGTSRANGKPVERCWCGVSGLVLVDEQAWGGVKTRVAQTAGLDYSDKSVFAALAGLEWFW